jgi:tRNA(Ile)-lysidine synthase
MASSRKVDSRASQDLPALWKADWQQWLKTRPDPFPTEIVIAYSGGADSTALLHAVAEAGPTLAGKPVPVRAVHFHHGLHPQADSWQKHCEDTCQQLGIALTVHHLQLADAAENTARQARYRQLARDSRPGQVILTAHHRQDQAETILLNQLRGAGLAGAAGIKQHQRFAQGWLLRPFLACDRATLHHWLQKNHHSWVEDPSNQASDYRRNFLRNEIFPRLQHYWPKATENLARSADMAHADWQLLAYFFQQHGPQAGQPLPMPQLLKLPEATRSTWLRLWLHSHALESPDSRQLLEFLHQCLQARPDRNPHLALGNKRIIRWKNHLYLVDSKDDLSTWESRWNGLKPLRLPGNLGQLHIRQAATSQPMNLLVRFYRGGESILLPGQRHHKRLKKLFQERAIAPWQRRQLPLVFDASLPHSLLAVGDWLVATQAPFAAICWERDATPGNSTQPPEEHWL